MSTEELRLECLKFAQVWADHQDYVVDLKDVMIRAESYFAFVNRESRPSATLYDIDSAEAKPVQPEPESTHTVWGFPAERPKA